MNPPVEAQASRQRRPVAATPSRSRTGASLSPPRLAQRRAGPARASGSAGDTSADGLDATAPATSTRPARMAALAASRLGARPRRTSSRSSRTRVTTGDRLQRLEALELGQDGGVDRLEGVRVRGRVGLVQAGEDGLDLVGERRSRTTVTSALIAFRDPVVLVVRDRLSGRGRLVAHGTSMARRPGQYRRRRADDRELAPAVRARVDARDDPAAVDAVRGRALAGWLDRSAACSRARTRCCSRATSSRVAMPSRPSCRLTSRWISRLTVSRFFCVRRTRSSATRLTCPDWTSPCLASRRATRSAWVRVISVTLANACRYCSLPLATSPPPSGRAATVRRSWILAAAARPGQRGRVAGGAV